MCSLITSKTMGGMINRKYRAYFIPFLLFSILFLAIPVKPAENAALRKGSEPGEASSFVRNAFWLNASLGAGEGFDTDGDSKYSGQILHLDMSAHLRYHHLVVSSGFQGGLFGETYSLNLLYVTLGKSVYKSAWEEVIFSGGISYNQLNWSDDMSDASRTDAIFMGIPLQFQYLFHIPVGIGAGIALDLNLNQKAITTSFSLQVGLGVWIL
jgi:hypothetical protein